VVDSRTVRLVATPSAVGALILFVIALQITYPLMHGESRDRLTVAIVMMAAVACLIHACRSAGGKALGVLISIGLFGYTVEVVGVQTGIPFGRYAYSSSLGPRAFGVPVIAALAWIMMCWPAMLVARRLCNRTIPRVIVGAWALAAWDLFLDPQLVAAGHWHWKHARPHLPGVDTVPLTNFAGWLLVALVISAALNGVLGTRSVSGDEPLLAFYLWTYVSSMIGLALFLRMPAAAAWGALGMGLIALPLAVRWRRRALC
jgi:putative membrane protein